MSFFILLTSVVHCKLQLRVFSFNTKRYERLYVICFAIYEKTRVPLATVTYTLMSEMFYSIYSLKQNVVTLRGI